MAENFQLDLNSSISKSVKFDEFAKTLVGFGLYWLLVNHLPVAAQ